MHGLLLQFVDKLTGDLVVLANTEYVTFTICVQVAAAIQVERVRGI